MPPKALIGVIGVSEASEEEAQYAFEVGKLIGALGLSMVCGGRGGVMGEASRGCQKAGGTVLGILPGPDKSEASPYLTYAIPTNLGQARNSLIAHTADLLIAVGKGYGTLSEIALGLKLGKKVLSFHSWEVVGVSRCESIRGVEEELLSFSRLQP